MTTTPWIEAALAFWHSRAGQYLGEYAQDKSLGGAYPMDTAKGTVKPNRIGAGTAGLIVIDWNNAIVVGPLRTQDMPKLAGSGVKVLASSPDYSLRKGLMDWVLSPDRVFPLLAITPGYGHSKSALRLSYSRTEIALCSPGKTMIFDGEKVTSARDALLPMGKEGRKWRSASRLRLAKSNGDYLAMSGGQRERFETQLKESNEQFPESLWLPEPGTPEYEALGESLIDRPSFPL